MPANTVVLQGNVKPDGTLELDGKVPLPPGKVQVILQPLPELPEGDPFFDMLRIVRAIRQRDGMKPDAEAAQAALRQRIFLRASAGVIEVALLDQLHRALTGASAGAEQENDLLGTGPAGIPCRGGVVGWVAAATWW